MTQYIKKLPSVFQTPTEKKFFDATVDQVFSKKDSDYLAGYLGRRNPGQYNPITDFYIPEPDKNRTWWQLEPTTYSRDTDNLRTNVFFYEDLLKHINSYGGNTQNQDRLFSSEFYTYAPPIDYDMFVNYQSYYWVEQRLPAIYISGVTAAEIVGQSSFTTPDTATPAGLTLTTGMSIILLDDEVQDAFTVEFVGCEGIRLAVQATDITAGATFEYLPWDGTYYPSKGNDVSNKNWDVYPWDVQTQPLTGDYITIQRGCQDRNAWSRTNKWYHIDAINKTMEVTGFGFPQNTTRALRPIIQFDADLTLYGYGKRFRDEINYGLATDNSGHIIRRAEMQGQNLSYLNHTYNIALQHGDLVVFFRDDVAFNIWDYLSWEDPETWDAGHGYINRFIFQVEVQPDNTVQFAPYTSWFTPIEDGDIVIVLENGPGQSAKVGETWAFIDLEWQQVPNDKSQVNQPPLFELFDHNGVALDDPVTYPGSNFTGNKIFAYQINPVPNSESDPVLGFPILYGGQGQASDIVFENSLIVDRYTYSDALTPISGYYYYSVAKHADMYNTWDLFDPCKCNYTSSDPACLAISKQRVIDKFVVGYGTEYLFKLSVTPFNYPAAPDIVVSVNGVEVNPATVDAAVGYTYIQRNNDLYIDLTNYLVDLFTAVQSQPPVVEFQTYTRSNLDDNAAGYFEIPQQLEANPLQEEVTAITGSNLIAHFTSIIANQQGIVGDAFGGPNSYRDTAKNKTVGTKIIQNVAPALKSMLVSSSADLNLISAERFSQDEYTKFKNRYVKTALQLINREFNPVQHYKNTVLISAWVDEILNVINVSREFSLAFAYSYMIAGNGSYASERHTVDSTGMIFMTAYIDLADVKNALYVYDVTGQETLLIVGKDYEITSTNLGIEVTLNLDNVAVGSDLVLVLYKNPMPAYIPSTPSKLGLYPVYVPRIELDSTYATPTNVIIGHDGSKTVAYGDYRDELLLELEKRVYNLVQYKFRNQNSAPVRLEAVKPGFFRETRYSRADYLDVTESYLNKWSAKNKANYRANDWDSASQTTAEDKLWKLYNYTMATDSQGTALNLPGHWKGIFQYFYDTIYPDTRPWEMLGISEKPTWWEYEYGAPVLNALGQSVWTSTAAGNSNMWQDIENGVIRQGASAIYDVATMTPVAQQMWARPGLSSYIPVDAQGEIISVMSLFDVVYSGNPFEPFDGYDLDWVYGDGGPVEQAWMSTSGYAYTVQEILFLTQPGQFGELMWDTLATEFSPGTITVAGIESPVRTNGQRQYVQNSRYDDQTDSLYAWTRPTNADQIVHAESVDNDVKIRFGYQTWISDAILFLGKDVSTTFGQKVRTLDISLANKLAGFINKDTTNTYLEAISPGTGTDTLLIPSNNFDVLLHTSPVADTYVYSGVIVRALVDGTFAVYGYDLINPQFTVIDRTTTKEIEVSVGGTPADFKHFSTNETYIAGEIVRYNGVYYLNLETQVAQKFIPERWKKLKALPVTGGVTVSYRPYSAETTTTVPYGHIFKNVQAVFDFLIGLGAYQESCGWKFEDVNPDTNQLNNWLGSAKQFLFWLNTSWAPDSSIQLSPLANKTTLEVTFGYPNDVESMTNGIYSILDKYGIAIPPAATRTDREGKMISIEPASLSTGGIYYLQVTTSETEHVAVFDNTTSFGDIVYTPLMRERQQRIRFNGFRSNAWYGKMEAPGYLVIADQLVPNFDTIVSSMRYFYDPNVTIDNQSIEEMSRHLIGYESKSYLDNLQISDDIQYLFYKGAIRQKGTRQAFDKLFRTTNVQTDDSFDIYEEWALRVGKFGNTVEQVSTEFVLKPEQDTGEVIVARLNYVPSTIGQVRQINVLNAVTKYTEVPAIIISPPDAEAGDTALETAPRQAKAFAVLGADGRLDRIDIADSGYGYTKAPGVTIQTRTRANNSDILYSIWQGAIADPLPKLDNIVDIDIDQTDVWVNRPTDAAYSLEFPTTPVVEYYIPNAGYVHFDDVTYAAFDDVYLANNWGSLSLNPVIGDTIWVASDNFEDWDVFKLVDIGVDFDIVMSTSGNIQLRIPITIPVAPVDPAPIPIDPPVEFAAFALTETVATTSSLNSVTSEMLALSAMPTDYASYVSMYASAAAFSPDLTSMVTSSVYLAQDNRHLFVLESDVKTIFCFDKDSNTGTKLNVLSKLDVSRYVLAPKAITMNDNGNRLYVSSGNTVYLYTLSVSYDLSTAELSSTVTIDDVGVINGICVDYYGYNIWVSSGNIIYQYQNYATTAEFSLQFWDQYIVSLVTDISSFRIVPGAFVVQDKSSGATYIYILNDYYYNNDDISELYTNGQIRAADYSYILPISGAGVSYTSDGWEAVTMGLAGELTLYSPDNSWYTQSTPTVWNTVTLLIADGLIIDKPGAGYTAPPVITIDGLADTVKSSVYNGGVSSVILTDLGKETITSSSVIEVSAPDTIDGTQNYFLALEYDMSDTVYDYYNLVNIDGTNVSSEDIADYSNISNLALFKTMRFEVVPDSQPEYAVGGDKIWVDNFENSEKWAVLEIPQIEPASIVFDSTYAESSYYGTVVRFIVTLPAHTGDASVDWAMVEPFDYDYYYSIHELNQYGVQSGNLYFAAGENVVYLYMVYDGWNTFTEHIVSIQISNAINTVIGPVDTAAGIFPAQMPPVDQPQA